MRRTWRRNCRKKWKKLLGSGFHRFGGEFDQFSLIVVFGGFVAGDFMAGLALVEENIFALFNLQAEGFHDSKTI